MKINAGCDDQPVVDLGIAVRARLLLRISSVSGKTSIRGSACTSERRSVANGVAVVPYSTINNASARAIAGKPSSA